MLSKPFVDENFAFYGKTLTGAEQSGRAGSVRRSSPTRSGRCLGKNTSSRTFGAEGKERTLEMVRESKRSCEKRHRASPG